MTADDDGLDLVARHLAASGGPPLAAYKDRCLRRRLAVRMRACGAASLAEYAALLAGSPTETERLLATLTINVTEFFRNPEVWDRLEAELLPVMRTRRGAVRAWTAGCASGEEPYSLALLLQTLTTEVPGAAAHRPLIDATDIDAASLERARAGVYPAAAVPAGVRHTRLLEQAGAQVRVPAAIRGSVRIRRHDLLGDPAPEPPYDLVLCRNVIIYFEREAQDRLLGRFIDALHPGGLLVLGRVETVMGAVRARLELLHVRERIYRRVA